MISFLKGTTINKATDRVTFLVGDVGYEIFVSPKTSSKLPLNKPTEIHIYTHVREDTLSLFGFIDNKTKDIFTLLLSVSGVGPKIALAIESVADSQKISQAIQNADVDFFTAISGLGKKSAQRIIVDLKSKLGELKELDLTETTAKNFAPVIDALKTLGFSAKEAKTATVEVKNKIELTQEEIIRQALKNLSKPTRKDG